MNIPKAMNGKTKHKKCLTDEILKGPKGFGSAEAIWLVKITFCSSPGFEQDISSTEDKGKPQEVIFTIHTYAFSKLLKISGSLHDLSH